MVTLFEQGDIIYLNFDPQAGHEQAGRRPALVVSNNNYNRYANLLMVCPITHRDRGRFLEKALDKRTKTDGVILCDQAKMFDVEARGATFVEKAPPDIVAEVADIIIGLVELV